MRRLIRAGLLGLALCGSAAMLSGCGFRPLYGTSALDPATVRELASVRIETLTGREGQLLRNALLARLNPRGEPAKPRYYLMLTFGVSESQTALRKDDTATRQVLEYAVKYQLMEDQTAVAAGSFSRQFSYDFLNQYYANVTAEQDTRRRAAEGVAEEVRNQLAAYFTRRSKAVGAAP